MCFLRQIRSSIDKWVETIFLLEKGIMTKWDLNYWGLSKNDWNDYFYFQNSTVEFLPSSVTVLPLSNHLSSKEKSLTCTTTSTWNVPQITSMWFVQMERRFFQIDCYKTFWRSSTVGFLRITPRLWHHSPSCGVSSKRICLFVPVRCND